MCVCVCVCVWVTFLKYYRFLKPYTLEKSHYFK